MTAAEREALLAIVKLTNMMASDGRKDVVTVPLSLGTSFSKLLNSSDHFQKAFVGNEKPFECSSLEDFTSLGDSRYKKKRL